MRDRHERERCGMGDQERITEDHVHYSVEHNGNIDALKGIVLKEFGAEPIIELIGKNQAYKIILPDRTLKVRRCEGGPSPYKVVLKAGLNVPALVKEAPYKESKTWVWQFVEWIPGVCHKRAINSPEAYKEISPMMFYKLGNLLGKIANLTYAGQQIALHDLIWGNFVIDYKEDLWLVDTKYLLPDFLPERWLIRYVVIHPCVDEQQRQAFMDGYIEKVTKRKHHKNRLLETAMFLSRIYAKLEK